MMVGWFEQYHRRRFLSVTCFKAQNLSEQSMIGDHDIIYLVTIPVTSGREEQQH